MGKPEWEYRFPAAGVRVLGVDDSGEVIVNVILDLGLGIYKTLKATLAGVRVNDNADHREIASRFVESWCEARPKILAASTQRLIASNDWTVRLYVWTTQEEESLWQALRHHELVRR